MSKYIVKIQPEVDWTYDWESNVCEDFSENVVLVSRRNYSSEYENASWWESVNELLADIDNCYDVEDFVDTFDDEYAQDKLEEVYGLYHDWDGRDEAKFKAKIAMLLYPGLDLTVSVLRGSSQGDWQEVVYVTDSLDEGVLEDWFFGSVYDIRLYELSDEDLAELDDAEDYDTAYADLITYGDDIDGVVVPYHELRHIERDYGNKENGFIKFFGLPEDSDITVIEEY